MVFGASLDITMIIYLVDCLQHHHHDFVFDPTTTENFMVKSNKISPSKITLSGMHAFKGEGTLKVVSLLRS